MARIHTKLRNVRNNQRFFLHGAGSTVWVFGPFRAGIGPEAKCFNARTRTKHPQGEWFACEHAAFAHFDLDMMVFVEAEQDPSSPQAEIGSYIVVLSLRSAQGALISESSFCFKKTK